MTDNQFCCAHCGGIFDKGHEEKEKICDACHMKTINKRTRYLINTVYPFPWKSISGGGEPFGYMPVFADLDEAVKFNHGCIANIIEIETSRMNKDGN